MPELPEVETTRRGIEPHVAGHTITAVDIRNPNLRWPVPKNLAKKLCGEVIERVERRAKYLLLYNRKGCMMMHLGMSGSLRLAERDHELRKHDHVVIEFDSGKQLRLHDPRRFGAVLWTDAPIEEHALIAHLGPEPLDDEFTGEYLFESCRGRKSTIKQHVMNGKIVVGVGNIYASESLFLSGIHPKRQAGRISAQRCDELVDAIKKILAESIRQGGTTLKDFLRENGEPGYFKQRLSVYDRKGEACPACEAEIRQIVLGQRSTFYCPHCQR